MVKSHFEEVSRAHNALETALGEEAKNRLSGDTALSARINNEESARKSADNNLKQSITDASSQLQSDIRAETAARQNADKDLQNSIDTLKKTAHTHDNAGVLSGISEEDVAAWRDRTDYDKNNGVMISFLCNMLIGQSRDMRELYRAAGVTLYDGGIFEDDYEENSALDGGGFDSDEPEPFDCSEFGTDIAANAAVLDGGRY